MILAQAHDAVDEESVNPDSQVVEEVTREEVPVESGSEITEPPVEEAPALQPWQTVTGETPGDGFGDTLALVGDIDKDGFLDFAVGASGVAGEEGPLAGAIYLYSGTDMRLLGTLRGDVSFARFGKAITFGDLTGNGKIELIVGAPYFSTTQLRECGSIHVFSFPECKEIVRLMGKNELERFGHALYCMDVNGDGCEDILVGAPGAHGRAGAGAGMVYAFSGNNGRQLKKVEGAAAGNWFGYSLTCMDLDQDGFSDLVASAPGFDRDGFRDLGRVCVYSGRDNQLLYSLDPLSIENDTIADDAGQRAGDDDRFGIRIQSLDDINGDGSQEFMVSASGGLYADAGIFDGMTGKFLYQLNIVDTGTSSHRNHPVISIKDYDRDSRPDLLRCGSADSHGQLFIHSGLDGALLDRFRCGPELNTFGHAICEPLEEGYTGYPRFVIAGKDVADPIHGSTGFAGLYQLSPPGILLNIEAKSMEPGFGQVLRIIEDLDNDNRPELVIGSPRAQVGKKPAAGRVRIHSCTGEDALHVIEGQTKNSFLGTVVSPIGDIDQDGRTELAITAPGFKKKEAENLGRVYFFSSKLGKVIAQPLTGNRANDRLGTALVPLGDINANKYPDFAVSAPGKRNGRPGTGRVLIIDGEKLRVFKNFKAPPYECNLGFSLGMAGDLDKDGILDLLCASRHVEKLDQPKKNRVYAFSSQNLKALFFIDAPIRDEKFGQVLAGIHDIDNDATPEILISAPGHEGPAGPGQGCVYICSGKTGKILTRLVGENEGDAFGSEIHFLPDQDGDAIDEICISARRDGSGRIYIIGSATMLPVGVITPEADWQKFGLGFATLPSHIENSPVLMLANASRGSKENESGFVVAYHQQLPIRSPREIDCKLAFLKPKIVVEEPIAEKKPPKLKAGQMLLLKSTLPNETLFQFNSRLGYAGKKRILPLNQETTLERETARQFVFFPTRRLSPDQVNIWLKFFWKKRTWPIMPVAMGFTFTMQYAEEDDVKMRRILCTL